jgi:nicotinate phosphoribosyltransferase
MLRSPEGIYDDSLALLTDLYQLTMAYGYWKEGVAERRAVFNLFFRKPPFESGYTVTAGLAYAIDYLNGFEFREDDLEYLAEIRGNDGEPIFEEEFLEYLREMTFDCDVDAVPEGRVVFPNEPIVRVRGPVLQAQLIETPLLNLVNFQTLIATKAGRVCHAAGDEPVLEFGLRRAQGIDGGLSAARAAYIGGCAATSNVLAGKVFDIPVKGTHAHSWVMFFEDELESFRRYADALPNNCVFLVDTYDTLEGVRNAVTVGKELRERGYEMVGIRLDSGDLAYLSIEARKILDEAGFPDAKIVASNSLDEHVIDSLHRQGSQIAIWGVGTKLATAYDDAALGGVYKLSATEIDGEWEYRLKLSEQAIKINNPGIQQVRRYFDGEVYRGDQIWDEGLGISESPEIVDAMDATRRREFPEDWEHEDLLQPIFRGGDLVYTPPTVEESRTRCREELAKFHTSIKRFLNPHEYPVGLDPKLHEVRMELIQAARERAAHSEQTS